MLACVAVLSFTKRVKKKRKQIEQEALFVHLDLYITQCVMSLL